MKRIWLMALLAGLVLSVVSATGCDVLGLEDEDEDDKEEPRPYEDIPALPTDSRAVSIDPYDGSVDVVNPLARSITSITAMEQVQHAVLIEDGTGVAVLDSENDLLQIIDVVQGQVVSEVEVGETVNYLVPSPYGPYVLAIYDPAAGEADYGEGGTINYFEMNIVNVETGVAFTVSIDFTPDNIVFNPSADACLLGRDYRLVYLDFETGGTTSYPLSLGYEDQRVPREIAFSPDGEFAIVLVNDVVDVYVLDLMGESINILDVSGYAAEARFIPGTRTALLPMPNLYMIAVIDLDSAIPEEIALEVGANHVVLSPDNSSAALYSKNDRNLVVLSLEDYKTRLYSLSVRPDNYIPEPVAFSPAGDAIVVFGQPGSGEYGYYDMDLVDLESRVPIPIGLEARPIAYAFSEAQPALGIVLPEIGKFVRLDLESLQSSGYELGKRPLRMAYLPGAEMFLIDHNDDEGRLTFIGDLADPEENPVWVAKDFFDR